MKDTKSALRLGHPLVNIHRNRLVSWRRPAICSATTGIIHIVTPDAACTAIVHRSKARRRGLVLLRRLLSCRRGSQSWQTRGSQFAFCGGGVVVVTAVVVDAATSIHVLSRLCRTGERVGWSSIRRHVDAALSASHQNSGINGPHRVTRHEVLHARIVQTPTFFSAQHGQAGGATSVHGPAEAKSAHWSLDQW